MSAEADHFRRSPATSPFGGSLADPIPIRTPEAEPARTPFATMTLAYLELKLPLTRAAGLILDLTAVHSRGHMVRPNGDWGGAYWCSVPGVATVLGVSPRTVQRALRELAEAGLILYVQNRHGYRLHLTPAVKGALAEASVPGGSAGGVTNLSPTRKEPPRPIVALGVIRDSQSWETYTPEGSKRRARGSPRPPPRTRGAPVDPLGGLAEAVAPVLARLGVRMGKQSSGGAIGALRASLGVARAQPIPLLEFHRRGFDLTLVEYQGYLEALEGGRFDHPERSERQGKTVGWLRYLEHARPAPFPAWVDEARVPCRPRGRGG